MKKRNDKEHTEVETEKNIKHAWQWLICRI